MHLYYIILLAAVPSLKYLDLSENLPTVFDDIFGSLATLSQLESLKLTKLKFAIGLNKLLTACGQTLTNLDLSSSPISQDIISPGAMTPFTKIKQLRLSNCLLWDFNL